jgi:hypothetical protein
MEAESLFTFFGHAVGYDALAITGVVAHLQEQNQFLQTRLDTLRQRLAGVVETS